MRKYRQGRIGRAREILERTLRWKKPQMQNLHLLEQGNFDQMWVLPIFLAPGKHDFLVRAAFEKDVPAELGIDPLRQSLVKKEPKIYYRRHIIDIREERLPAFSKQLACNEVTLKFVKKFSVFADWEEDTEDSLAKALRHDMTLWKIERMTKDPV